MRRELILLDYYCLFLRLTVVWCTFSVAFMKEFQSLPPPPFSAKRQQEEEEEDKGRDSLVPSYVYDALKEKKRFDSMRVRITHS